MPYANNKDADSVAEQAGLSLTRSQTPEDKFSREVAQFIKNQRCCCLLSELQSISVDQIIGINLATEQ